MRVKELALEDVLPVSGDMLMSNLLDLVKACLGSFSDSDSAQCSQGAVYPEMLATRETWTVFRYAWDSCYGVQWGSKRDVWVGLQELLEPPNRRVEVVDAPALLQSGGGARVPAVEMAKPNSRNQH